MKVYEAKAWFNNIEIRNYEVTKDTEKQIRFENGRTLNKSVIGNCDSVGTGYGYTLDEAVQSVKNNIINEISECEAKIKRLKKKLELPIMEK